jgi:hypothetical protein
MKNIKEILNHLPFPYDKIKMQRCLKLLISGLPIHIKKNIVYLSLQGETLICATKHPTITFELYQKLGNIKMMLKAIQSRNRCKSVKISHIQPFTIKYTKKNLTTIYKDSDEKYYIKHRDGSFENRAKNGKVYKKFEEIRKIIKEKAKSEKA